MKRILRAISFSTALILVLLSFCSCFGKNKQLPEKQTVNNVYKYNTVELLKLDVPRYDNAESYNGETNIGNFSINKDGYLYTLQTMDKNYALTDFVAHIGTFDSEETTQIPLPVYDNENGYRGIRELTKLSDGLLATVYENVRIDDGEDWYYENNFVVEIYNLDGTVRSSLNVTELMEPANPNKDDENSYFGIDNVFYGEGDIFVKVYGSDASLNGKIYRYGLDGTSKGVIEIIPEGKEGYINNIRFLENGKMLAPVEIYGDDYKQLLITIDLVTGERTEIDAGNNYEIMYRSFVGADGGLYYISDNGIYLFDLLSGEETLLMDFINSDYVIKNGSFYAINSNEFVSITNTHEEEESILELTTFNKVPDEQLVPKYLITVASAGGAYNFRDQIIEFNRSSEEYRIKYIDYSQYNTDDDYRAGQTKLNNDIIAGNVPDVLITDQEFSAAKYANKNLFVDLYTYLDNDTELTRGMFLENILKACETNGKLYEIPTNIYLMGFIGQKDRIDNFRGLTVREFADKVMSLPEGESFFRTGDYSRNDLLELFFFINYVSYINPTTGLCSLNNDDFKATLEWLNTQPEKSRWEQEDFDYDNFDHEAYNNMFKEGKAIAVWASLQSFEDFQNYSYDFGDVELDYIGAPSPDRDGMVFTATNLKFLVSSKSNFPDQAWNFVKVFFTEENQRDLGWGFPVIKKALDAEKQEALERIAERDAKDEEQGEDVITGVIGQGGVIYKEVYPSNIRRTTREDVEKIYGYVMNVNKQLRYDESILDIIKEEASEYFGGKKKIDDVAAQAESRVNIKIGEQM